MSEWRLHDAPLINFRWLLRLRWWVLVGQICTVASVEWGLRIALPLGPLVGLIALGGVSNALCEAWARQAAHVREGLLAALMGFDVLLLTGLLSLTGGPLNPFSCLYLVHIALAAVVLQPRLTWMLAALSLGCFGLLFVMPPGGDAAHLEHMRMHLEGMWLAFGVAAGFIVYFVQRVTRALAAREAELRAARHLAARNERFAALATLAGGAAHELSTPLSTIAVVAKELEHHLHDPSDAEAAADVRLIREQVTRCRDILMQMAADVGQGTGEAIASVPVEDLVEAAVEGLPRRDRLQVNFGAGRGQRLQIPARAVAQALRGVLKNAHQASREEAAVRLDVVRQNDVWHFIVRDSGAGMPPDVLERAGEPFFTTKAPGQGMGLGLFLTRTVLARLGGGIELTSVPGRGTTAVLTVPATTPTQRYGAPLSPAVV
ncbi:MAG TPA: ATP-binding protein [Candidatus Margulisiibacteriota bacterium]|nr:ATP-binding protein [Candidatus Margulisiibacteriota bacterium]